MFDFFRRFTATFSQGSGQADFSPSAESGSFRYANMPQWLLLVLFIGCYLLLDRAYFLIPNELFQNVIYFHGVSTICADLINWLSPLEQVLAQQNHVLSTKADLEIVRGCDGAGVLFLLMSAILVFPAGWRQKLLGLLLGIGLVYGLNLLRVSGLYFVVAYYPAWFLLVHTYLAPSLMVILGCGFFAWWAFTATSRTDDTA